MSAKVKHLVIDSSIIFKDKQYYRDSENVYITNLIANEIRDERTINSLSLFPENLIIKEVTEESIEKVKKVAGNIGELKSLSDADISLIALCLDIQNIIGKDIHDKNVFKNSKSKCFDNNENNINIEKNKINKDANENIISNIDEEKNMNNDDRKNINTDKKDDNKDKKNKDEKNLMQKIEMIGFYSNPSDSDWISPDTLGNNNNNQFEENDVFLASCDLALQNTALHLGITVLGIKGEMITAQRDFIYRCDSCSNIFKECVRTFCEFCGQKGLRKVGYTIDQNGDLKIRNDRNYRKFVKEDNSWMSSLSSLRKNGGAVVSEDQLKRIRSSKGTKKTAQKSNLTGVDGNPLRTFDLRDTNSRSFTHGYHLRNSTKSV